MNGPKSTERVDSSAQADVDTAYHEAGHVVVACFYGRLPLSATIERDGDIAGTTEFEPNVIWRKLDQSSEKRKHTEILVVGELAGTAAHNLFRPGRGLDSGDEHDLYQATELIIELVIWVDEDEYLKFAKAKATDLLETNWVWVEKVAEALLAQRTLTRAEIVKLIPSAT